MIAGGIDMLVGTQIVAKGHHFPGLTLVGVVERSAGSLALFIANEYGTEWLLLVGSFYSDLCQ